MACKQDASKRIFEMKQLEPEPESPFLDEEAYDLPTRKEVWDSYEAEPELQLETPFASAFAPAEQENSGLAAEEGIEGEIEPEELEGPGREPEEETGEEEGEFEGGVAHARYKTWAGEFIVDEYYATENVDSSGYGANITIRFKSNKYVDAEKIAFVQTALSMKDGKHINKFDNDKDKQVNASRMIPASRPGVGTHIDQMPYSRTPLFGMKDSRGNDLSDPQPNEQWTEIGCHYTDTGGKLHQYDAKLHDVAELNSGDIYTKADVKQEWHQIFETTALAISGNQKGMYYGSVQWGWEKRASDTHPRKFEFKIKSEDFPSPIFMEAAKLWNASVTSETKATIDLPIGVLTTYKKNTPLWDIPDGRKKVADLAKNTRLGLTERLDPQKRVWWLNVIVVSGPHIGKTGWLQGVDILGA